MRIVDILGLFFTAAFSVAALSVILRPGSQTGQVLDSFGKATSDVISASKS